MRTLKADKATKDEILAAVQVLQSLKAEYKQLTGSDYDAKAKPEVSSAAAPSTASSSSNFAAIWEQVQAQGDKVSEICGEHSILAEDSHFRPRQH